MQGFLNLNKQACVTSHDCVARVRRLLRLKRVGHGGTLDPAATGVLPIALGKATRLLQYLRQDKAYKAKIRLGMSTATDDLEGETIATQPADGLSLEQVKSALGLFQGTIQQVPPSYSAIQVQGKRLYDLARAGKTIEVSARPVEVYKIEILSWHPGEFPELDVAIACGPGTYIRAIARDLGAAVQTGGTLAALTRTESCGFSLADSLSFDELEAQLNQGMFHPIPPTDALEHLASVTLPATNARRWCQGQPIPLTSLASPPLTGKWDAPTFVTPHPLTPSLTNKEGKPEFFPPSPHLGEGIQSIYPPGMLPGKLRVHHEDGSFLGIGCLENSADEQLLVPQMVFEPIL